MNAAGALGREREDSLAPTILLLVAVLGVLMLALFAVARPPSLDDTTGCAHGLSHPIEHRRMNRLHLMQLRLVRRNKRRWLQNQRIHQTAWQRHHGGTATAPAQHRDAPLPTVLLIDFTIDLRRTPHDHERLGRFPDAQDLGRHLAPIRLLQPGFVQR